ncbi:MAG: POTRA domain-containing protein [Terriglobales bacterium]|jgi:surface antigen-like variable number repeat protein
MIRVAKLARFKRAIVSIALLSCLPLPLGVAQQHPNKFSSATTPHKLIALKAIGTTRYTDKEILGATGLQFGQDAADGDFKEAVQRLGESGVFTGVAYSYSSTPAGTKLELQLADIDKSKLVLADFDNFVWFTDEQLVTELQQRVPLFKRLLPIAGKLPDHVSEALQAMLTEKHYPGRVDYLRVGTQTGGPLQGIDYHVEEVDITIRSVEFPGASPEQASLLATAGRHLTGAPYRRSAIAAVANFDLLPVYLQRGYLKAAFAPSDAHLLAATSSSDDAHEQGSADIQVAAIIPVTPGKVYATSGVDWKGNSAIATAEIAPLVHLPNGQPADAVSLVRDLENVGKLYRSRGYFMAQISPDPHFDDEKATVHYDLMVSEGALFKMGELEIQGLDSQSKARLVEAWALQEGQPYNADYLKKFLDATRQLLPRGGHWGVTVHVTPDTKDKTVDVELRFRQD